jgi:CO/xanthine dehydrogenase Mo-binding subunit
MDLPNLESIIVEHANEQGPYGVKGVGEPPVVAAAAAVRNALCDALGFKIDTLPLTANRVLMEIKKNADGIAER